jgi:hypothetical protein
MEAAMTSSAPGIAVGMVVLFLGFGGLANRFDGGPHSQGQEPSRYAPPVRGVAEIGFLAPKSTVEGDTVVTTIDVKNLEGSPVAGLKAEEFWWDKSGNLAGSAVMRLKKALGPLEVATFTLKTPRNSRMFQNTIRFSHSFGPVKAVRLKVLD